MVDFACVVPPLPADETTFICVELLIPMGWVKFPLLFCAASETVDDMENLYISDPSSSFTKYGPTSGSYYNFPSCASSPASLQGTDINMNDIM